MVRSNEKNTPEISVEHTPRDPTTAPMTDLPSPRVTARPAAAADKELTDALARLRSKVALAKASQEKVLPAESVDEELPFLHGTVVLVYRHADYSFAPLFGTQFWPTINGAKRHYPTGTGRHRASASPLVGHRGHCTQGLGPRVGAGRCFVWVCSRLSDYYVLTGITCT